MKCQKSVKMLTSIPRTQFDIFNLLLSKQPNTQSPYL